MGSLCSFWELLGCFVVGLRVDWYVLHADLGVAIPVQPSTKKKHRKERGGMHCGNGRIGKHRKHASGRGNAGGQHMHRIAFDKYHPGYFGKVGMRYFHYKKNPHHMTAVNVDKLWSMVGLEQRKEYAKKSDGTAPLIDLTQVGGRPAALNALPELCWYACACGGSYGCGMISVRHLQVPGQGQAAQAAHRREGEVLLQGGREEDQGRWRRLHPDRIRRW